ELSQMSMLSIVDLSHNCLTSIPLEFQQLSYTIKEINLSHNHLHEFPAAFFNLTNLEKLDLSCNRLHRLPDSTDQWDNFKSLKLFNLSGNELPEIPAGIYYFVVCFSFVVYSFCFFKQFKKALWICPNLEIMIFSENEISTLPSLEKLKICSP